VVHHGVIGSANILLKDPKLRDKVRDQFSVRAIEMEGSGIMDAGWVMDRDIMVVRGVCDYCDDYKSDTWQRYAALAAASYARGLIEALPEDWFP
jgi:nucleoside phosphorylase